MLKQKKDEKASYHFGIFIKTHWILFVILFLIPVVACIVFSILLCKQIRDINDLGSFLGGLLAYVGTVLLGAVSMWQNEKLKFENDRALEKQREQAEHDKQILLEQNARIANDNIRLSVLPIFAINRITYKIRKDLFDLSETSIDTKSEEPYGYTEKDSSYFAIKLSKNGIVVKDKEIPEIKEFKNTLFKVEKGKNGVCTFKPKNDGYLPYLIKNVGKHDAMGFSFSIYREGCSDENFKKSVSYRPFSLTDTLRLDFYIADYSEQATYWLELRYKDIFGNEYCQKDYIKVTGENADFCLLFKQELVDND